MHFDAPLEVERQVIHKAFRAIAKTTIDPLRLHQIPRKALSHQGLFVWTIVASAQVGGRVAPMRVMGD